MKWKFVLLLLLTLVFSGLNQTQAETSAYEKLSDTEKKIVDTVLDQFRRHHMVFLQELSDNLLTLNACTGIIEGSSAHDGTDGQQMHDHDENHLDEDLAVRVIKATPDASGKFQPPTFTGPDRTGALSTYTYREIYTVAIENKKITVSMSRAEDGKAERLKGSPDKKFIDGLASRLQAKAGENGVILLP